ncbi:hypothetical protein APHAL10511_002810, partial [Amanita phalloides]
MMPHDVWTWWNSTYDMLKFSYTYCDAIDKLTGECALNLWDYELTEHKWEIMKQLWDSLWIIKIVTLEFSTDMPCLAIVIPAMDQMHDKLTTMAENMTYSPVLHTVLALGQKLLNKYYSLTNDSELYCITIVLHPQYKLCYFEKLNWDPEWIKTAEQIIKDEFKHSYSDYVLCEPLAPSHSSAKKATSTHNSDSDSHHPKDNQSWDMSSDDEETMNKLELDCYLVTGWIKDIKDLLAWWYENRGSYPH